MNHPRIFAFLTVFLMLATIAYVLFVKFYDKDINRVMTEGIKPILEATQKEPVNRSAAVQEESEVVPTEEEPVPEEAQAPVTLRETEFVTRSIEEMEAMVKSIPTLKSIPWLKHEVEQSYNSASRHQCRMLPPDAMLVPLPQGAPLPDGTLTGTRLTAFTIGLQVDPAARNSLPRASRAAIEKYLDDHLLAVQPLVYQGLDGVTFGTEVYSAFFARNFSVKTLTPEPMITEAVSRFRVLGTLQDDSESSDGTTAVKTLVLAFNYTLDSADRLTGVGRGANNEYELLFLQLVKTREGAPPRIAVFATTQGRETFQELDMSEFAGRRIAAPITANIRFDDFTLLGLYPSDPVVTGVQTRARSSWPVQDIRNRQESSTLPAISFPALLQQLHERGQAWTPTDF